MFLQIPSIEEIQDFHVFAQSHHVGDVHASNDYMLYNTSKFKYL